MCQAGQTYTRNKIVIVVHHGAIPLGGSSHYRREPLRAVTRLPPESPRALIEPTERLLRSSGLWLATLTNRVTGRSIKAAAKEHSTPACSGGGLRR
jgi:hypothetical protein